MRGAGGLDRAAELVAGEFLEGFGVPDATDSRTGWPRSGSSGAAGAWRCWSRCADELTRAGRPQEAVAVAGRAPRSSRFGAGVRAALRSLSLAGDRAAALELSERFQRAWPSSAGQPGEETRALVERVRRAARRSSRRARRTAGRPLRAPPARRPSRGAGRLLEGRRAGAVRAVRSLVLLEGESGVGKTRLLEEMLARLRLDGVVGGAARAVEGDRGDPWSGVLALARGGLLDAPASAARRPPALSSFAALLTEWADRFPGARPPTPAPLARALVEAVSAAATEQPVVLAVDDAQWLDADSALSLGAMLRDLHDAPLTLVLVTAPYPPRPELDELRSRLGRDLDGGVVTLRRLDRAALRHLAERMLPGYDPISLDRVVRRVATDSGGLPLFAVELLRAVALGLDLGTIAGTWPEPLRTLEQSLPGDLPDAVVAAIRVAFRRLSPAAQRVLVSAAVLGDLAAPAVLERALEMDADELARALDELEWHRWLVSEPRGYSFAARIVRQVVQREMVTPGQRRRVLEAARESTRA